MGIRHSHCCNGTTEEAIRALFTGDERGVADRMEAWPPDVKRQALKLATTPEASDSSR